ncbi:MAG: metallophosphoesterase, partial [Clostridia bacterium]|nr:metallophosphoesterase [Clostridia bacterium]
DVHYAFDTALKTGKYFGDETDVFVLNGDIGEVETIENFYAVLCFTGELSSGKIPMIFTRGNHDTRGKLSEKFCDFFPTDGGKTYYKFSVGVLSGVVLDCGEDKPDVSPEYDNSENTPQKYRGINAFHAYRERQADFLENVVMDEKSVYKFAICHIPPVYTTKNKGSIFDIEKDIYEKWSSCLEMAGINFMLCGHIHSAFILSGDDERSTAHHEYPVVIGSRCFPAGADLWGAAINLKGGVATVKFTDKAGEVAETHTLDFNK